MSQENFVVPALKETTVTIKTENGTKDCPALTHEYCPGLAVTMSAFGVFTVTHIKSGLKMCPYLDSSETAILVFSQFALIGNDNQLSWDIDKDAIRDIMKCIDDKPVPFESTITVGNEERKQTIKEWMHSMSLQNLIDDLHDSETLYEADENILLCKPE